MSALLLQLIPLIIAFVKEKKSQKVKTTDFLVWLVDNNHNEISAEISNTLNASIYIKALLNEKLPILEALKNDNEIIINFLLENKNKNQLLLEKLDSIESKLPNNKKYKQLINILVSEDGLVPASEEKIIALAEERIKEFKEYSKNQYELLDEGVFDKKYNNYIKKGKIIEAKSLLKSKHLNSTKDSAKRAFHLGELSYYLFDYKEAEMYFCKAADVDGTNIKYLKKAALIKNLLAKYTEGLRYYNTALQILKKTRDNIEISHLLSDLGLTYERLGNYDKALELYKESNQLTKQEIGTYNSYYIITLNNIAQLYTLQGKLNEAANIYVQVVQYDLKHYDPNHKILASDYNNIAGVLLNSNKFQDALKFFELAYTIYDDNSETKHFRLGIISMNIAICLSGLGRINQAKGKYEEVELILLTVFGDEHDDVGLVRFNKACFLYDNGYKQMAIESMQKAYFSFKASLGDLHKETREAKKKLKMMKE